MIYASQSRALTTLGHHTRAHLADPAQGCKVQGRSTANPISEPSADPLEINRIGNDRIHAKINISPIIILLTKERFWPENL